MTMNAKIIHTFQETLLHKEEYIDMNKNAKIIHTF